MEKTNKASVAAAKRRAAGGAEIAPKLEGETIAKANAAHCPDNRGDFFEALPLSARAEDVQL